MPTFPIDGRIYLGTDGAHWVVCRRPFPDSPAQSANVDTGELRVFEDHHVAEWLDLRLTAVIRIIGGHTYKASAPTRASLEPEGRPILPCERSGSWTGDDV